MEKEAGAFARHAARIHVAAMELYELLRDRKHGLQLVPNLADLRDLVVTKDRIEY